MKLTSSNTFSNGLKKMSLRDYIRYTMSGQEKGKEEEMEMEQEQQSDNGRAHPKSDRECMGLGPSPSRVSSNETFYLFGNNHGSLWDGLKDSYTIPPCLHCDVCGARTIGIGGHLSGVSFHYHGPGFSEVIIGRKRWFLFPPHDASTSQRESTSSRSSKYDKETRITDRNTVTNTGKYTDRNRDRNTDRESGYFSQFDPNMTVDRWLLERYPTYRTSIFTLRTPPSYANETESKGQTNKRFGVGDNSVHTDTGSGGDSDSGSGSVNGKSSGDDLTQGNPPPYKSRYKAGLLECAISPGELLYFPSNWMHATLNIEEYNVFVSHFLDFQLIPKVS